MNEVKVHEDTRTYEPRNVFGMFTTRGAICGAVLFLIVTAAMVAVWRRLLPDELLMLVAVPPAVAVGVVMLWQAHGLKAERAAPALARERRAAREMTWAPPEVRVERAGAAPAPSWRELRADRRERRREGSAPARGVAADLAEALSRPGGGAR